MVNVFNRFFFEKTLLKTQFFKILVHIIYRDFEAQDTDAGH